jgi:hypothetical protein
MGAPSNSFAPADTVPSHAADRSSRCVTNAAADALCGTALSSATRRVLAPTAAVTHR